MNHTEIIEQLSIILTELDARDSFNNCITIFKNVPWKELCEMGIKLLGDLSQ